MILNIKYFFITLLLGHIPCVMNGQPPFGEMVPNDLMQSKVVVIKYSKIDWRKHYIDSTSGRRIISRYGEDFLYKNYLEALEEVVSIFKKKKVTFKVIKSIEELNKNEHKYLFDYNQIIIDNHESIIADKLLGGFFFIELKSEFKYKPIIENKKYIGKILKESLRKNK